jgi:hypothetical protein
VRAVLVFLALTVAVAASAGCTTKDNGGVITPSPTTTTTR